MDTHDAPVPDAVWPLYAEVQAADRRGLDSAGMGRQHSRLARSAGRAGQGAGGPGRLASAVHPAPRRTNARSWLSLDLARVAALDAGRDPRPRRAPGPGRRSSSANAEGARRPDRRPAPDALCPRLSGPGCWECLAAEFPCLRALAGEQVFDLFAAGYIAEHPSSDPSLYGLGAGFAAYLEATRPPAPTTRRGCRPYRPTWPGSTERGPKSSAPPGWSALQGPNRSADLLLTPGARLRRPDSVRLLSPGLRSRAGAGGTRPGRADRSAAALPDPGGGGPQPLARHRSQSCPHGVIAWLDALRDDGEGKASTSTPPPRAPRRSAAVTPAR
jgi:hypothetical protein